MTEERVTFKNQENDINLVQNDEFAIVTGDLLAGHHEWHC